MCSTYTGQNGHPENPEKISEPQEHTQVRKPTPRENIGIHSTLGGRFQDDFKGNPNGFKTPWP